MDEANQELRVTIKKIWPLQAKKVLDLIIPQDVGKFLCKFLYRTVVFLNFKILKSLKKCIYYIYKWSQ